LALSALSATATSSVATVPDGLLTLPILHGVTNYLSLPLTRTSVYASSVSSVTTTTISVDDSPAPFTSSLMPVGAPYFIKFLSGNESGRVMLITAYSPSTLTLDTTDNISGEAVALTTTGFSVQPGDTFEIFPGDTLASVFGDGSTNNPLVLAGGTGPNMADTVGLCTVTTAPAPTYYFSTVANSWVSSGSMANANNTIIYPYSGFTVVRRANQADTSVTLSGRVTQVAPTTKLANMAAVVTSTHLATDIKVSQLQLGSRWIRGTNLTTADTISVWNPAINRFDVLFQLPNKTWRKFPDTGADQSNYVIAAGTVTTIERKQPISGASLFIRATSLPYSLQ
jgi:uncharacterized protein (TIGR02597 family)